MIGANVLSAKLFEPTYSHKGFHLDKLPDLYTSMSLTLVMNPCNSPEQQVVPISLGT